MGVVITLNKVDEFPENITSSIIATEEITIDNVAEKATTRFYNSSEETIDGYQRFEIEHRQKYMIEGIKYNQPIQGILKVLDFTVFKKENDDWLYTFSDVKGDYAIAALRRLKGQTGIKTNKVDIDLIAAVENIANNDIGVMINSGWFSHLIGANLDNVLLQAEDVNNNQFWTIFKETPGAKLSNIELIIEDDDFANGRINISISKRGYINTKKNIEYKKMIELTERIIKAIGIETITTVET